MDTTFDFVIVGAGTAGSVVATRLSEDRGSTVALVEAGGTDLRPDVMIPGASALLHKSSADWGYYTDPQTALFERRLYYPRGRVVGGSGSTNTLVYVRGDRGDFDGWEAEGATGWGWDAVLPYFKRAENLLVEDIDPALQGRGGPLAVARPAWEHPLVQAFVDAGLSCGLPHNTDFNRSTMEGVGRYHVNVRDGVRQSTARAYLRPALGRRNLELITSGHVEQLVFEGRRCVGVQLRRGRELSSITARREVLLCAGAIGSPALLMRSGVGPAEHLREMGRPVVLDHPHVGEHLQDHPLLPMSDLGGRDTMNTTATAVGPVLRYLARRAGPLSSPLPGAGGFARTSDDPRPDVQFHFAAAWAHDLYDFAAMPPEDGYTVCVTVSRPASRGRVRLGSGHFADPPRIDPGFMTDARDLATMARGVRLAQRIFEAPSFAPHRRGPVKPPRRLLDDADIHDFIRRVVESNYHPTCTCRMGPEGRSVVAPDLRVHGVDGLRVIDASVMPSITTGNTNAPTLMIAERGAELVSTSSR